MNKPSVETYIGKHLLFGITYLDHDENLIDQVQLHGTITRIEATIIAIRLHGSNEEFTLPPDLDAINEAPPGEYKLRSTGEVVENPDLLATWTVTQPKPKRSKSWVKASQKTDSKGEEK